MATETYIHFQTGILGLPQTTFQVALPSLAAAEAARR